MQTRSPVVSVVIPTYNRASFIRGAIESVLTQTYGDLELLVVDDGSTDDTPAVVAAIRDARLRYIRCDTNEGAAAARNRGIREARGEYVAFQDSDDVWLAGKLDKQMRAFDAAADAGVVYCGFRREHYGVRSYIPDRSLPVREGDIHQQLLIENFVSAQTIVARRSALQRAGPFDPSLQPLEDWDMALRLSKHFRFALVDEPLVQSRMQTDSISADVQNYIRGFTGVVAKHEEELRRNAPVLAKHYGTIAHCLCVSGQMREGRSWYLRAVRLNPAHLPHAAGVLLSFLGRGPYLAAARLHHRLVKPDKAVPFLYGRVRGPVA
ncbi:MAG: hypothetical protein BWK77_04870 [Verrucomicrobia bacterium A1]|nr:MAG: hypothetical protein BWK77_04870 [Verrucomicrobia bacterium A1]